jgi:hypothetical protein
MFSLHSSLFDVKIRGNFINADTEQFFGADMGGMSALSWVTRPKEWITQMFAKWVAPLANATPRHAFGNFSGRHLSFSRDGRMVEVRVHSPPVSTSNAPAAASSHSSFASRAPLTHGKLF